MQVNLRPVAITDLSVRYARDLGNRRVRHYRVSAMNAVAKAMSGQDVCDLITQHIKKEEGMDNVNVVFENTTKVIHGGQDEHRGAVLKSEDVSPIVLQRDPKIRKALAQKKALSLVEQYNYYPTIFHRWRDRFADLFNRFIANPLNKLLLPSSVHGFGHYVDQVMAEKFQFKLPVPYMRYVFQRRVDLVRYIAVAFRASQTIEATNAMLEDLRTLQRQGLIKGALAMPSVMELADTVGVGERFYVMFCFPLINDLRLEKILGSPLEYGDMPLNKVGCKYETREGGVNWLNGESPDRYYEIEQVDVGDPTSDQIREQVIQTYKEAVPVVNKVAKAMDTAIKEMEKSVAQLNLQTDEQVAAAKQLELDKLRQSIEAAKKNQEE